MRVQREREILDLLTYGPPDDSSVATIASEALTSSNPYVVLAATQYLRTSAAFDALEAVSAEHPPDEFTIGRLRLFLKMGKTARFMRVVQRTSVQRSTSVLSKLVGLIGPQLSNADRRRIFEGMLCNPFATGATQATALEKLMPTLTVDDARALLESLLEGGRGRPEILDTLLWAYLDSLDEGPRDDLLTQLATSHDARLRTIAYSHIERMEVRTMLPVIVERLETEIDEAALHVLLRALVRVADARAERALTDALQHAPERIQIDILERIGEIGTPLSLPALAALKGEKSRTDTLDQAVDEAIARITKRASIFRGALSLARLDGGQLSFTSTTGAELSLVSTEDEAPMVGSPDEKTVSRATSWSSEDPPMGESSS